VDHRIGRPDGRLLDASHDPYQQPGLDREIPSRPNIWEMPAYLDAPETQQRIMSGVAEAAAGDLVRFQIRNSSARDSRRVVDFTLTPIRDDGGSIVNIIAEERDIAGTQDEYRVHCKDMSRGCTPLRQLRTVNCWQEPNSLHLSRLPARARRRHGPIR
jgi:hypothetical protein